MDINHFKEKLASEKQNLEKEVASYKASDPYMDNRMSESYDDDISEMEGHDRVAATENDLKFRLEEVNEALKRIEEGTFGKCANCGQDISEDRLEAMPTAKYCASCQESKKAG